METASTEALVNAIEVEPHTDSVDELVGSINSCSYDDKTKEEEKLKQKLRFFYMNPIEKWQYKQRFPYKFLVQLIKIIIVTLQSCLFAHYRSAYIDFVINNRIAFCHLFLLGWDSSREIISYPPQSGDLAVYQASGFYSAVDYAVINYGNLENAIGSYSYTDENNNMPPLEICFTRYKVCDVFGFNESYVFNNELIKNCYSINITKAETVKFSSKRYFLRKNITFDFTSLVRAELSFGIKTVNLRPAGPKAPPDCFRFNLTVGFDNSQHDGKLKVSLTTTIFRLDCKGSIAYESDTHLESILHSLLNSVVIIFCIISLVLCSRAIYRAQLLRYKTVRFLKKHYNKVLSLRDQLEFVNIWYLTMITSDCIIIIGSGLKEKIEKSEFTGDEWNICSVMLGAGTFLIWVCVLRYLGFFKTYNVVVLTLKVAAPMILRFMVCTMLIYAGFTFCGWLVLGPYHTKFRTLSLTSECLFALINGDDVFGTFSTLQPTNSSLIWWFSRIYLYFFISIFIYVILSLFVSVILDAYETIKHYYSEGFPKNEIQEFIDGGMHSRVLSESSSSLADICTECCTNSEKLSKIIRAVCCCSVSKGQIRRSVPES